MKIDWSFAKSWQFWLLMLAIILIYICYLRDQEVVGSWDYPNGECNIQGRDSVLRVPCTKL